jgi:hypothetical protein
MTYRVESDERARGREIQRAGLKLVLERGTRMVKVGHITKETETGEGATVPLTHDQIVSRLQEYRRLGGRIENVALAENVAEVVRRGGWGL